MLYNKALLYISLPTLKSYNNFHQELIRSIIINNVTDGLTIYISSPKFENYSKTSPISSWSEINDFLNAVYICGSKIAYEIEKYFIDIVVIFENWCGYQVELGKDFQAFFGSFHGIYKYILHLLSYYIHSFMINTFRKECFGRI